MSDSSQWRKLFVPLGLWLCWRNSVNSSVNQIWNRMMFTLLRHSQWTEMTFQIDGWYVTGPDIVKWHGRWEKHAFIKLCIITTSPRIEHLAGVFVAACTARRQQFHQLVLCSYTVCFIKTWEQLHWVYFCLLFYSKISKRHLRIERWCQAQQIIYRGTLVGFSF